MSYYHDNHILVNLILDEIRNFIASGVILPRYNNKINILYKNY